VIIKCMRQFHSANSREPSALSFGRHTLLRYVNSYTYDKSFVLLVLLVKVSCIHTSYPLL
jgi:hypothetical protein